jgi:hypothetical protein
MCSNRAEQIKLKIPGIAFATMIAGTVFLLNTGTGTPGTGTVQHILLLLNLHSVSSALSPEQRVAEFSVYLIFVFESPCG